MDATMGGAALVSLREPMEERFRPLEDLTSLLMR